MLFQSARFAVFLVLVLALYWALVGRRSPRYWLLLAASYVFYGSWEVWYLSLLVVSTFLDYACGARIHATRDARVRKRWLWVSLVGNLGMLGFFKYWDWGVTGLHALCARLGFDVPLEALGIAVPVGISFYTFQTLSYTIDIYRGVLTPARSFGDFALFVAFFPQLVAGPIVRAIDFLPQLDARPTLERDDLHDGLYRLATGLVKKVVLADVLARYLVDPVYADPGAWSPAIHLLALYGFTFQIYFDFSGYSDCAIGAARLFGFRLAENFDAPFRSRSVREFWRRWHISLSSWVRDYVFFPMGGSRTSEPRVARNLILTMLVIGLWHGASVLWVCYGLLQGVVMVGERWLERARGGPFGTTLARRALSFVLTFHFVALTLTFVRAQSLGDVLGLWTSFGASNDVALWGPLALVAGALTHYQPARMAEAFAARMKALPTWACGVGVGLVAGCVAILVVGDTPFIYFQF